MGKRPGQKPKKRAGKASEASGSLTTIVVAPARTAATVVACLDRIARTTQYIKHEVVVVGPVDSAEIASGSGPLARSVPADGTVGALWNAGIAAAEGDNIALLDPEMVVEEGWLKALLRSAREPGTAVVGGRVIAPDGMLANAGFELHPSLGIVPRGRGGSQTYFQALQQSPMLAVDLGAALLTRAGIDAVAPFDAQFDGHHAGLDFCLRARCHGLRALYCPACRATDQRSSNALSSRAVDTADLLVDLDEMDRFHTKWETQETCGDEMLGAFHDYANRFPADAAGHLRALGVAEPARLLRSALTAGKR